MIGLGQWAETPQNIALGAQTVLRGSTTRTEARIPVLGRPYRPREPIILQADRLVADYKLQAAEALYRKLLKQNAGNPGALNGLGKIAFYKTTSSNQHFRDKTEALQEEAIDHFLAALRYQPGYIEAHVNLASVYMEQDRLGEADEELYKALRLSPKNALAWAKKGEWLVRSHKDNDAIPVLQKAIKLNSADAGAHYFLAVAQWTRNEQDAALQNLHTALWLQPHNGNAHYLMGLIYEKQGNGAAAVEHYLQAVSLKPELYPARMKLARHYERRGDITAALEQLKNVMETGDPDWELADHIGQLSILNDQPEEAVKVYRKWLQTHPEDSTQASNGLSQAKTKLAVKKLRDDDLISQGEAHRYAEQALKAQPNNVEARMIQVKLDREIGTAVPLRGKDATELDAALTKPVYQQYQSYQRGELLMARYQFREAEQAFRNARRAAEGKRSPMQYGEIFLAKGLPGLAEESFQQVLAQLPGNASARLGLAKAKEAREQSQALVAQARLEHKKNTLDGAVILLQRALQSNIENSEAHYLLGQVYEKQSDYAAAADQYYAYVQLEPMANNTDSVWRKIEQLKRKARDRQDKLSGT